MIICVLEIPENSRDNAQVIFVDLERFSDENPMHAAYRKALLTARDDENKMSVIDYETSCSYGTALDDVVVEPPCLVSDSVTLFIE